MRVNESLVTCVRWLAAATLVSVPAIVLGENPGRQAITIPAITFTGQGGGEVSRTEPAEKPGFGFIHFWYTPGHWLEWVVDDAPAGEYRVTVGYAGRLSVKRGLALNGRPVSGLESFTLEATGRGQQEAGWDRWSEATLPVALTLAPGRNTLRMTCVDDTSVRLREIVLTSPGKPPVTIPAGRFSAQGGGRVQVIAPPVHGAVGARWSNSWNKAGHWLEWTVEAPAAGRYAVGLHYRADGYCRLELQVNGEKVKGLEDFIPPKTGALNCYTIGTLPVPVALRQGKNTLRLTTLGGQGRGVPQFDGMIALSAIHLTPLAEGATPGDDVLTLSTMEEIRRAATKGAKEPVPPAPLGPPLPKVEGAVPLKKDQSFAVGGNTAKFTEVDVLPYVENEYAKGSVWDHYDNPKLKQLRETYELDKVVASGKTEYEKQVLLLRWVWDQWSFGHAQELYNLTDPPWILSEARREHVFQCMHSGSVMMSTMASMGWVCRRNGHPTHTWNEVWSNQHRKWVFLDATSNIRHERKGVPLNSYEYYHARHVELAEDVVTYARDGNVWHVPPKKATVKIAIYGANTYVDGKVPGRAASLQIGEGLTNSFDPQDLYFPINQAAMALVPKDGGLQVTLGTMTPNFKEFQVRMDGGPWKPTEQVFPWPLKEGENRLEARSVNRFGIEGSPSTVVVRLGK